jgi:hypothetical protein
MSNPKKAYAETKVDTAKSRGQIEAILRDWGATGLEWQDDFATGSAVLRFRWPVQDGQLVARLMLTTRKVGRLDGNGRTRSAENMRRAIEAERRRVHRVAFHWLKTQREAIVAGLFGASDVMLPFLEDASGRTVAEAMRPHLSRLAAMDTEKRLALPAAGGPGER